MRYFEIKGQRRCVLILLVEVKIRFKKWEKLEVIRKQERIKTYYFNKVIMLLEVVCSGSLGKKNVCG